MADAPLKINHGTIECTLVNGVNGDPSVFTFFNQTGDALLFDLGSLDALTNRELLKVRHALVSHTHIDHFIGFDRWLRVNIPHGRDLEISGPTGIIENVRGKLLGYTWNLLEADQIKFRVHEIDTLGRVKTALLSNNHGYRPQMLPPIEPLTGPQVRPLPDKPAAFITNLKDKSRIEAVCLDHGIPSVAYLCQSPLRFNVNTDELDRLKLTPGPWIRNLQIAIAEGDFERKIDTENGQTFTAKDIGAQILTYSAPRAVGYLTDIIFSLDNLTRVRNLMLDVELLICETNFRDADHAKAAKKKHLTTKQAAIIAAYIKADQLRVFHISNVYSGSEQEIVDEAASYFEKFRRLDEETLMKLVTSEIQQAQETLSL